MNAEKRLTNLMRSFKKPSINKTEKDKESSLLSALRFLSLITKEIGPPNETHVWLGYHWAYASNGAISAACKIEEDINCCPHNITLIEALSKCGQNMSFTQLDPSRLSIKSDKFKVVVPCIDPSLYFMSNPDEAIIDVSDNFVEALKAVSSLASQDATRVVLASILINGQSVIATDGKIIFEYWHGINLPSNLAIPRAFADVLTKSTKKLIKFGYSSSSVTFYFHDESWIKSQLYAEEWPDVSAILDRKANAWPLPPSFWQAVTSVAPFSPDGIIHSRNESLHSHSQDGVGASFECPGIPPSLKFFARQMGLIKPWAEIIDFFAPGPNGSTCIKVFGKNIRGMIAGIV